MLRIVTTGYTGPLDEDSVRAWLAPFFHPSAGIEVVSMVRDEVEASDFGGRSATVAGKTTVAAHVSFPAYPGGAS